MAQVLEFKLPDLGEGLTEAEIVRWLVQVGDVVAVDQPVVEVETAKASVEVPCPYGGVVTARYGEEGAELPVGAPLLTVAVGEPDGKSTAGSGNVLVGYGTSEAPGRRRRVRPVALTGGGASGNGASGARAAVNGTKAASPGVNGTAAAPASSLPATALPSDGPVPVISPLVRRLAREGGLDLRRLAGSGPDGLILRADVERALRAGAGQGSGRTAEAPVAAMPVQAVASASASASVPGEVRVPLKGIRGAVADKLSRSRREIPDATCWVDADATELMRARAAMNAAGGTKISLVALLARICAAALARFPELNSSVDTEAREIVQHPYVHLGFAAQTERGLVVPVVRDAHTRDAESLTGEFARLTEAARAGTLTPGELTGGTFTLNNYGVFGVDGSTPIVNHPEAAMLGVGRIVPKPWVHEGELAVRQVVQLSLTFDHRVCDGGTAGGFLRYVADCVEQPAVLLRTL
ncbi:dihydrolipoamide acetyltransferase family protein [Streptomyces murinus]|uniref:Dihydrolipoamide acetyltransferase component of pyruvate dehydrogenase complex n=1 Tax=Streptomyces murinus TaxID=33900 RepID=A0A7W3RMZ1_STRMR|nr:dihydrolipoamide acetyltransferase family protein [Streptomyces murinus]MBA9054809.1 pyruvate dehydrogenase E2 component (dihydrolipoamide acetyltransferase) [Streptomyces murinus]UWW89471.1 2-oxo acid dehydrogenase subunit E2 [Streptomyces murinus]